MFDKLQIQLKEANAIEYSTVDGVAYLNEPYHQVRLMEARRLLYAALGECSSARTVVELGAATGEFSRLLASDGYRMVAVDQEPTVLASSQGHVALVCADVARSLPFGNNSVDGVFMGELLEHLFDTRTILAECFRVIKPGGVLVLTTPNLAGLQDRIEFLWGRSPRHVNPLHRYLHLHIRPFTAKTLFATIRASGFVPIELRSNHIVFRWGESFRIRSRLFARVFPSLGGSLIVSAQKPA